MEKFGLANREATICTLVIAAVAGLAAGCGDILSSSGATSATLLDSTGLTMTSVEAFVIEASPAEGENGLKAVLSDGTLAAVPLTEGTEGTVSKMHDTPLLLILEADGYVSGEDSCSLIALSKSDGSLLCVPYRLYDLNVLTELPVVAPVQASADGAEIFFTGLEAGSFSAGGLIKFAYEAAAEVPAAFSQVSASLGFFAINDVGDLLLGGSQLMSVVDGGSAADVFLTSSIACMQVGSGADGSHVYFFAGENGSELYKATKGTDFTSASVAMTDNSAGSGTYVPDCTPGSLTTIGGAVFATGTWTPAESTTDEVRLLKISGDPAAGAAHALASHAVYKEIQGAGSNLYVWGTNSSGESLLSRVSPSSLTPTSFGTAGVYTVTDMHVNSDETLFFAGTEGGVPVIGKVAASGVTVTEIDPGGEIAQIISIVPAEDDASAEE